MDRVEEKLRALRVNAPTEPPAAATALPAAAKKGVNPNVSPYVGPQPFSRQMAGKFFGRQHDAEQILDLIDNNRAVLVYAPSGAGKSSLLNTLINDTLEDRGLEVLLGARVGGALPDGVTSASIRNIFTYSVVYGLAGTSVPNPRCTLQDALEVRHKRPGIRGRVIIFDQFEELFTQHTERFEDRKGFVRDVIAALQADPGLRVVFAMRQEYLADIDPLLADVKEECSVQRFALRRIDLDGALEAITGPAREYAGFAPGVAEDIVTQLNTIRVAGFDGVVVPKRGEFIEMVHLQIVCQRLWASLPAGVTEITREHVERAAGPGKPFSDFVVNALNAFYDDTLDEVARSRTTKEAGGYSKALLQLGCMKFVTTSATRTMIERKNDRTGRLPNWIVDQLEKSHLLRVETRGGQRWYELSHDRLAEPVARRMNRDVSKLLFAADLLDTVLNRVKEERKELTGYFGSHREVVTECESFHRQVGLFEDEMEFVFRASLAVGVDVVPWSRRVAQDFPEARRRVLYEATQSGDPAVRCNAASLMGDEFDESLSPQLLNLALSDRDASVRKAALQSLAKLDRAALFDQIKERLGSPATQADARQAVAHLRVLADRGKTGPAFDACYESIQPGTKAGVRTRGWGIRLASSFSALPYVVIPAVVMSSSSAGLFKWVPGIFGYAICQARPSLMAGLFHGVTAATIWGGFIPFFLMVYRLVFMRKVRYASSLRPYTALLWGAIAGLATGFAVTSVVVGVFDIRSLVTMGWVTSADIKQYSAQWWEDLFITTRFGWAYIITGCAMGVGMAIIGNGMRANWKFDEQEPGDSISGRRAFFKIIGQMMRLALPHVWAYPICLAVAAAIVLGMVRPADAASPDHKSMQWLVISMFFDCGTQLVGGYFAMVGVGVGVVLMTRGVRVEPRKDEI
jgi:hypothetical protein